MRTPAMVALAAGMMLIIWGMTWTPDDQHLSFWDAIKPQSSVPDYPIGPMGSEGAPIFR